LFGASTVLGPADTPLSAWCMRAYLPLSINTGQVYTGYLYSSYETTSLAAALPETYIPNLDNINWLLNHYRSGADASITVQDMQVAVWALLHQVEGLHSHLAELALQHDGYVPDAGETLAVIVDPVGPDGTHDQTTIVETLAAKLGDLVWEDTDADGIQDTGEAGIAGATVQLVRDLNGDGQFTGAGEVLASTTTDANGNYSFKGLTPGLSYQVQFVSPAGFDAASARQADGSSASGANSDGKVSELIVLKPGEYNATIDSGYYKYASLGDRVWNDTNANGVQDAGESGKAGVVVQLYTSVNNTPGTLVATQTTDANGNYGFSKLKPGDYVVKFIASDGSVLSTANVGSDALDSDAGTNGFTGSYRLASGENNATVDAGFYKTASLGDRVWNDTNGNGVQDAGEAGRAGVKVELYDCSTNALMLTTTTDANGNYQFANLVPGTYHVKFLAPGGALFTTVDVGNDALDSDANGSGITGCYTLNSGDKVTTVDAGFRFTTADAAKVCEDRSTSFNVLANDASGFKLVSVAHETAALDTLFQQRGGAISFTAAGQVTYDTMTNHYGKDKLVYTVEDAAGNRTTQTIDMTVAAVSDAPTSGATVDLHPNPREWERVYKDSNGTGHWVYGLKVEDFGQFSDRADALQQFGTYNASVADDTDTLKQVVISGLKTNTSQHADLLFDGRVLDFSAGQTYTISVADILAGKLDIDCQKSGLKYVVAYQLKDSGAVDNTACYDGSVLSVVRNMTVSTPIALDLNGDGHIGVTGATASSQKDDGAAIGRTVQFDIDADGKLDTIEWFDGSGDGILIDNRDGGAAGHMDGSRLFGDQGGRHDDGYAKLRLLDANGDGRLSGGELAGIELWMDNGDGVVQDGEIQTLAQHGIASLSTEVSLFSDAESRVHLQSSATREDGSTLLSEDVFFLQALPAQQELLASDASLDALLGTDAWAGSHDATPGEPIDVTQAAELLRKLSAHMESNAVAA
jgi:protocatechuate 3,4-dioxygenase beta subunit